MKVDDYKTVFFMSGWFYLGLRKSVEKSKFYIYHNHENGLGRHTEIRKSKPIIFSNDWKKECLEKILKTQSLTLIRESWEKIQNAGPSPSVFCGGKIQSAALRRFVYISMLWIFSQKTRSATVPKNGIYFSSARHISSHIGICHLKFTP